MSRGLGKWQRLILEALEYYPAFYLGDLLGADCRRSDYVALNRAMMRLLEAKKIDGLYYRYTDQRYGYYKAMVCRFGVNPSREDINELHAALDGKGLSVDGSAIVHPSQHLKNGGGDLIARLGQTPERAAEREEKAHGEWVNKMAGAFAGLRDCMKNKG